MCLQCGVQYSEKLVEIDKGNNLGEVYDESKNDIKPCTTKTFLGAVFSLDASWGDSSYDETTVGATH